MMICSTAFVRDVGLNPGWLQMSSSSGSRRRLALGLLLFALGAAPLDAQQAAEQPASGGQTTPTNQTTEPRPVPPAEIATRATEVVNRLREIRRVATPVAQIQKIAEDLPAEVADIGEFRRAEVNQNFAETAPRLLDEAQQQWERHESTLKRWNDELDRRARDVQAARDEINGVDELWRLTAEARHHSGSSRSRPAADPGRPGRDRPHGERAPRAGRGPAHAPEPDLRATHRHRRDPRGDRRPAGGAPGALLRRHRAAGLAGPSRKGRSPPSWAATLPTRRTGRWRACGSSSGSSAGRC